MNRLQCFLQKRFDRHTDRITRVVVGLLGCCVALASPDRVLAANAPGFSTNLAENATAADETTDTPGVSVVPQNSPAAPQPQPDDVTRPSQANPVDTLPLDLPLPPTTSPSPVEPEKPADPQQEEQPEKEGAPKVPRVAWPNAAADSPLFGTEAVTQFTEESGSRGKWSLRPHFGLSTVYDANIFISNADKQSGFIALVSGGLSLRVGSSESPLSIIADYTATAELFLEDSSQDTVNQAANFDLRWTLKKLTLDLRAGVSAGTGTSVDIGGRVKRYGYSFGIGGNYELGAKTSFSMNVTENLSDFGGFIGSSTTRIEGYFNYQFRPKLNLGVGGALSFLSVQDGADQVAEEFAVRAVYAPTQKLTFSTNFGVERREYSSGIGDTFTPVFGLSASWLLRLGTQIGLSASRSIFSSASLGGQNYIATGISLNARQRFTDRCNLTMVVGFENFEYEATQKNVSTGRVDHYFYIRPGFELLVTSYCSLGVYYEYSRDDSDTSAFDFQRDRLGLQVSLRF